MKMAVCVRQTNYMHSEMKWHTWRSERARRRASARLWPGVRYFVLENVSSSWWLCRTSKRIWPPLREVTGVSPARMWLVATASVHRSDGCNRWWFQGLINCSTLSAGWILWEAIAGKYGMPPGSQTIFKLIKSHLKPNCDNACVFIHRIGSSKT